MITVNGKYNFAHVMNDTIDEKSREQIEHMCNLPIFKNSQMRFMADVHAGKGCAVIGTAMTLPKAIVPYVIGVDIGCAVLTYNLGQISIDFEKLDVYIKNFIPNGKNVNTSRSMFIPTDIVIDYDLKDASKKLGIDENRVINSIGSLGGGNHFIEIDKDLEDNLWLTIHSGSRNFGLQVANFHQNIAKGKMAMYYISEQYKDAEFLVEKDEVDAYLQDMMLAQQFAQINRETMARSILNFLKITPSEKIESVHNFIDFSDSMIRKGAIRCYPNESLVIPLNMRDGIIVGTGVDNEEVLKKWNYSAPHGAGRKHGRMEMKRKLESGDVKIEEFQDSMKDVWTSCVDNDRIDESPFAYKDSKEIIEYVKEIVEIRTVMKPVYNFKAKE